MSLTFDEWFIARYRSLPLSDSEWDALGARRREARESLAKADAEWELAERRQHHYDAALRAWNERAWNDEKGGAL